MSAVGPLEGRVFDIPPDEIGTHAQKGTEMVGGHDPVLEAKGVRRWCCSPTLTPELLRPEGAWEYVQFHGKVVAEAVH